MIRAISREEVRLHNNEKDCWIIVHGKVYDITRYLCDHPGGVEIVIGHAGEDATTDYDDVGHTGEAHTILEKFIIGTCETAGAAIPENTDLNLDYQAHHVASSSAIIQSAKSDAGFRLDDATLLFVGCVIIPVVAAEVFLYERWVKA